MKALAFTEGALNHLARQHIAPEWLSNPTNGAMQGIYVHVGEASDYIFTSSCNNSSPLLVVDRKATGLFYNIEDTEKRQVFDRCARLALRGLGNQVTLNPRWMPYHHNNRVSVFAYGAGSGERILCEVHPQSRDGAFVYAFGSRDDVYDIAASKPDYDLFEICLYEYSKANLSSKENKRSIIEGQIDLDPIQSTNFSKGFTYEEWYPSRLSQDQIRFIDHKLTGPLRLRGAAGTGKTLAMALKLIKVKREADSTQKKLRLLFLTHSWSMAEHVDQLVKSLDPSIDGNDGSSIDIFPLLAIAEKRDYKKIGRQPLGIDSDDGKRLALDEIDSVISEFVQSDWIGYRSGCSITFSNRLSAPTSSRDRRLLCWDLLVEFGCVIAAQGILTHSNDKEKYLRIKRLRWMMPLDKQGEKETVFALWTRYMKVLREKSLISSDQIVSDYLNDLSTFYWEAARREQGYDIVFVDEMHLFNAQERLIFHNLLSDGDIAPLVVMALDPKQSPRETFTSVSDEKDTRAASIFDSARLPHSEKIDLTTVHRYTPQIGRLVRAVHAAAPALDFSEDWDVPAGQSSAEPGPPPTCEVVNDRIETFKSAIKFAQKSMKEGKARSGKVAILCLDSDNFGTFARAASGQYPSEIFVISSRDDTEKLRYATKKAVVSTPEYVAGLQFDTVVLVDANKDQVPDGNYHSYQLRRFLAELYLGISRAERQIHIIASREGGGLPPVFLAAIEEGALSLLEAT